MTLDNYKKAVEFLIENGSRTAKKVHIPHGRDINDRTLANYGRELLKDARDDFDKQDGGRSLVGRAAVRAAAVFMGIEKW